MRQRFTNPRASHGPLGGAPLEALTTSESAVAPSPLSGAFLVPQVVRPFAFPSFDHLDDQVQGVIHNAVQVEGLQASTPRRWLVAYRSFRRFLQTVHAPDRYLAGDTRVQQVLLEEWIAWLRESGCSRNAIATYWRGAAALLGRVARADQMFNPFLLLAAPKENLPVPRFLSRDRAEALLRILENAPYRSPLERSRNVCLIGLLMMAGLRRQEALRLRVSDVALSEGTLLIRLGKGRNGGRDRTAYMTPQLSLLVATYLRERLRAGRTHPELLTSVAGDRPFRETALRRLFLRLSTSLGCRVTPHMLRHTYATLLRQSGVPDRVAMDLLGHKSLAMLQRYSHVADGEHRAYAGLLTLNS